MHSLIFVGATTGIFKHSHLQPQHYSIILCRWKINFQLRDVLFLSSAKSTKENKNIVTVWQKDKNFTLQWVSAWNCLLRTIVLTPQIQPSEIENANNISKSETPKPAIITEANLNSIALCADKTQIFYYALPWSIVVLVENCSCFIILFSLARN